MAEVRELRSLLHKREERIRQLEQTVRERNRQIQELLSKVDQYKAILGGNHAETTRRDRGQGISAEPAQGRATLKKVDKIPR